MRNKNYALLFVLILIFYGCSSDVEENTESNSETTTTLSTVPKELPTSTTTTVQECIRDDNSSINFERVRNVQLFLNKYGFNAGDVDGYIGNRTTAAIRDFQRYAGLYPDGDIGPLTREAMKIGPDVKQKQHK